MEQAAGRLTKFMDVMGAFSGVMRDRVNLEVQEEAETRDGETGVLLKAKSKSAEICVPKLMIRGLIFVSGVPLDQRALVAQWLSRWT